MEEAGTKKMVLRIPRDLHAEVVKLAERDDRSINREIVAILRKAVVARMKPYNVVRHSGLSADDPLGEEGKHA